MVQEEKLVVSTIRQVVVVLSVVTSVFLVGIALLAVAMATGAVAVFNVIAWLVPSIGIVSIILIAVGGPYFVGQTTSRAATEPRREEPATRQDFEQARTDVDRVALDNAREYFGASIDSIKDIVQENRSQLEQFSEQIPYEWSAQTEIREMVKFYMWLEEEMSQAGEEITAQTERAARRVDSHQLPIERYDELNVSQISARLEGLTDAELKRIREYEKQNKNRETVIAQIDRKTKAAS